MKKYLLNSFFFLAVVLFLLPQDIQAQSDYRSTASGNWSTPANWEVFDGLSWNAAITPPSSSDGVITIRNGHNIAVSSNTTIDQSIVETGATLTVNAGTLTIANGSGSDLSIDGSFVWGAETATLFVNSFAEINGTAALNYTGVAMTNRGNINLQVTFNGSNAQTLTSTTLNASGFAGLTMNNANGLTISGGAPGVNSLNFIAGNITTGGSSIELNAGGTITGASATNGYVIGAVSRNYISGTSTLDFPVGNSSYYCPVNVSLIDVDASDRITVRNFSGDAPSISSSAIEPGKSVNTYWLFDDNTSDYVSADVTFNWDAAQVDGGAITSNFIVGQYYSDASTWSILSSNTPLATSISATGIADFTDMSYAVGEQVPVGAAGDYRTIASGFWSDFSIWERSNGTIWEPALISPSSTDGVITIRNNHTVDIFSSITLDQTFIEVDGVVKFNAGTLTIADGPGIDLNIEGPMEWWAGLTGSMDVQSGAEISGSSNFNFSGAILTNNGTFSNSQLGIFGFSGGQTMNGTGTISSLLMFNPDGLTLGGDQTITTLLNFNYGPIITGTNKIIITSTASIQNNASPLMYVQGNLQINFPAGGMGLTYPHW
jgi:hypothetical protein